MGQHIATDEALDVLTLEGGFKNCGLKYDIVWKDEAHKILVTGNVRGRRRVDVGDANRIEAEKSRQSLAHDATSSSRVDHGNRGDGRRNRGAGLLESSLDGRPDGDSKFNHWADGL